MKINKHLLPNRLFKKTALVLMTSAVFLSGSITWSSSQNTRLSQEQRIQRLENALSNRQDLVAVERIQALESEVQLLTGQLEEFLYQFEQLQSQQRDLYRDLDRRLQSVSTGASNQQILNSSALPSDSPVSSASPALLPSSEVVNELSDEQALLKANSELEKYQSSYDFLQLKRYDEAKSSFNDYIEIYPNGRFAPNAYYWLGEIALLQQEPQLAEQLFQTVRQKYPTDDKARDSLLKLGDAYMSMGDNAKAKEIYESIVADYSGSSIAHLAQIRLKQI